MRTVVALAIFMNVAVPSAVRALEWQSPTTGGRVSAELLPPTSPAPPEPRPSPLIVYLKNLSIPRLAREADESILRDVRSAGHLVLVLDYARHAKAVGPALQADVLQLRREVGGKTPMPLLGGRSVDPAAVFILPEGFRLKRNIEFARDGQRALAMDVMYPADPERPVPALLEITCDNVNRMGNGSLVYCHDTLLEGAMLAGFAAAMIEHPVRPPYKGLDDPMPQLVHRLKAAVRTLRAEGVALGLNGRIGAMGFSRGGNMAALLATTGGRADLDGDIDGRTHAGVSSAIGAALVHGGRYDYTRLSADDPMLARFEKAWGPREANPDRWAAHGAAHYLRPGIGPDACPPMFLNTSDAESPEFRHGLKVFAERLREAGVAHVYHEDADGRGHRVTIAPATLKEVYGFFRKHLGDG